MKNEWQKLNKFEQVFLRMVWIISPLGIVYLGWGLLTFNGERLRYADFKNVITN